MQIFWQKVLQKMQKSYFFGGGSQKLPKMGKKSEARGASRIEENISRLLPRAGNGLFNLLAGKGVGMGATENEELTVTEDFLISAFFHLIIGLVERGRGL